MPRDNDVETSVERVDPLVGTIFDKRFRVEERIASGGFGAIYRATHIKSGHPIALKVLLPSLAQDLGVVARFRREGDTLTALRNKHTISAYELGQAADRTLFIVMELLHGESLFERYRANGPFEWKRMVKIGLAVCESLEEAHARGIVHRDLKPTNIHLEEVDGDRDFVKVLDFGIAKILRGSDFDSADITNAGQMIGTLDYMSPEQMLGGKVTGQSDIYTLGIVMYEMIAGCTPFPEAMTAAQALASVTKTKPEALFLRAPVPEELDRIVMRCLERDVSERYHTVAELRADLQRLLAGGAVDRKNLFDTKPVPKASPVDESTQFTPPPQQLIARSKRASVDEATSFTPPPQQLIAQSRRDDHGDESTQFTPPPQQLIARSRRDDHGDEATSFTPPPEQLLAESRRARRPSGEQTSFTPPPQQILDELRAGRRKASPVVEWTDDDERAPTTLPPDDASFATPRPRTRDDDSGLVTPPPRAHDDGRASRPSTRGDDSGLVTPPPRARDDGRVSRPSTRGDERASRPSTRGDERMSRPSNRGDERMSRPPTRDDGIVTPRPRTHDDDSGVVTPPLSRDDSGHEASTVPFSRADAVRALGEAPTIPAPRVDAARAMRNSDAMRDSARGSDRGDVMRGDIRVSGDDPMRGDAVRGEISTDPFDREDPATPPPARAEPRRPTNAPPPIPPTMAMRPGGKTAPPPSPNESPPTISMRPGGKTAPPPSVMVPPRPTSPPFDAARPTSPPMTAASPPTSSSSPAIPAPRPLPRLPDTPIPSLVAAPFSQNRPPSNPAMPQLPTPPPGQVGYPHPAPPYPQAPYQQQPPQQPPYPQPPQYPYPTPVPMTGASAADLMRHGSNPMLPSPMQPGAVHTPVPHQPQPYPTPPGVPSYQGTYPQVPARPPSAKFDMGRMAEREAFIRKLVWIIVLVVGTGVGFILATQL